MKEKISLAKLLTLKLNGKPLSAADIVSAKKIAKRLAGTDIPFLELADKRLVWITRSPGAAIYTFSVFPVPKPNETKVDNPHYKLGDASFENWGLWNGNAWATSSNIPLFFPNKEDAENFLKLSPGFKGYEVHLHGVEVVLHKDKKQWGLFNSSRDAWIWENGDAKYPSLQRFYSKSHAIAFAVSRGGLHAAHAKEIPKKCLWGLMDKDGFWKRSAKTERYDFETEEQASEWVRAINLHGLCPTPIV